MRMVFAGCAARGYGDAREKLTRRFVAWAGRHSLAVNPFVAQVSADRKAESDGALGRWTVPALRAIVTEWFPRNITLAPDELPTVIPTLHAWIEFLADEGLLDSHSDDTVTLHRNLDTLAGEFDRAMADPASFGPAKFWAATMRERGVDPTDPEQTRQFIADLDTGRVTVDLELPAMLLERQMEERLRPTAIDRRRLPPVLLANDDDLRRAADASQLAERMRRFVDWLGDGRPLTTYGHLRLADARTVATLLGTGDDTSTARRGNELPGVTTILVWATTARLARVVKGRLVPIRRARPVLADPLKLWDRLFGTFGRLGGTLSRGTPGVVSPLCWQLESVSLAVLGQLYGAQVPVPVAMLEELAWEVTADPFLPNDQRRRRPAVRAAATRDFRSMLDLLEQLGAVRRSDDDTAPVAPADGGPAFVGLTALGTWGVNRMLRAGGAAAPVVGDLAGETAEVMLAALTQSPIEVVVAEVSAWRAERTDEQAAGELAELIARTDDPQHRMFAMQALAFTGAAGIAAAETLRGHNTVGPLVGTWLVDQGVADPATVTPREALFSLVENLAALATADPCLAVEGLSSYPKDEQLALLREIHQIDHPQLPMVLDAMVEHPDRDVARAAARARLRYGEEPD